MRTKPCSQDARLHEAFGAPVTELYELAAGPDPSAALTRALELRSLLVVAETQVARIRDRVHEAMSPKRDMNELSADGLRMDAQWLEAALRARSGYRRSLDVLLRTMPPYVHQDRAVRRVQEFVMATLPPATDARVPLRAGAPRSRRP
ncbi:hypothetical protein DEJ46_05990 [Streptomyces venezuelae]|uniref:Uncharacterized protein n=1 Tax=Streptomyces venezuelae TaxID=54571 RepID=A0A5P2B1R3_STRVZ|nr:hypothetical protein DEJ46_05990 [Streptomyces venezuelae]